jgi:isopentenyl diphosphate isomerase/L-lactate dehydrogenase-like FMN-dependent dehydrogenase
MRSDARLTRSVRFPRVVNIADLRELARRRVPAVVFAYIDGGAEDEITLRENSRAFSDITFRPRQCVAVPACDLRTTVLGATLELPLLLAPVGFCRMFYPRGEVHAAREANAAGTAYILSTFSGTRLEEVRQGTGGPLWYQLYVPGGRAANCTRHFCVRQLRQAPGVSTPRTAAGRCRAARRSETRARRRRQGSPAPSADA